MGCVLPSGWRPPPPPPHGMLLPGFHLNHVFFCYRFFVWPQSLVVGCVLPSGWRAPPPPPVGALLPGFHLNPIFFCCRFFVWPRSLVTGRLLPSGSRAAPPGWGVAARFSPEPPMAGTCHSLSATEGDAEDQSLQHQLDQWWPKGGGFGWHTRTLLHCVSVCFFSQSASYYLLFSCWIDCCLLPAQEPR